MRARHDFEAHPDKSEAYLRELGARCAHRASIRGCDAEEYTECLILDMYNSRNWQIWRDTGFSCAWAAKCAANIAIDFLHEIAQLARTEVSAETYDASYEACTSNSTDLSVGILQDESRHELQTALATLTLRQQRAMRLRFLEDCTYVEIADLLTTTPDAVRMLISRALVQLHKRLLQAGIEEDEARAIWSPPP